jgi:hypothetical protein
LVTEAKEMGVEPADGIHQKEKDASQQQQQTL